MAEVLGIVSGACGIAAFSLQIIDGTRKLRHFCSKLKHARLQFEELLDELDVVAHLIGQLEDLESTPVPSSSDPMALEPYNYCQKASKNVLSVLKSIEETLPRDQGKTRGVVVKLLLREKQIEEAFRKLERAKSNLMIAEQYLTR